LLAIEIDADVTITRPSSTIDSTRPTVTLSMCTVALREPERANGIELFMAVLFMPRAPSPLA
jgi:hypothetical protein